MVVAGAPLDFRLGYGSFGGRDGGPPARVVQLADAPGQLAGHLELAGSVTGDLGLVLDALTEAVAALPGRRPDTGPWRERLRDRARAAVAGDRELLDSSADPIHPARVYGELLRVLADDAVVIGDGGDFVSFAGRFVEPARPGNWLDPGPYGCLGTGLGYAIAARLARPSAQVVLLLGDGAAGFSLMDVDTLVRHDLPVVIVCGNNGIWGLEKHPMRMLYGYDVAADLQPQCRYDRVAEALGAAGELVTSPPAWPRRSAAPSPPASPTWSTWPPTPRSPTPAPPPASRAPRARTLRPWCGIPPARCAAPCRPPAAPCHPDRHPPLTRCLSRTRSDPGDGHLTPARPVRDR